MENLTFNVDPSVPVLAIPHHDRAPDYDVTRIGGTLILLITLIIGAQTVSTLLGGRNGLLQQDSKNPIKRTLWYNHKDPILGLDILWRSAVAVHQGVLLEMTRAIIAPFGRTVSYLSLGRHAVLTIDPVNLKAMLSQRFADYSLGGARKNGLQPLFGNGIFNSDGSTWKVRKISFIP